MVCFSLLGLLRMLLPPDTIATSPNVGSGTIDIDEFFVLIEKVSLARLHEITLLCSRSFAPYAVGGMHCLGYL